MLWLWHRLAATTPIGPLAWEPPNAVGAAPKRQKTKKKDGSYQKMFPFNEKEPEERVLSISSLK